MNEKQLIKWFKTHVKDQGEPYILDKNQARVILDAHKNTLVTARAGSGKTRTIVAKIVYLLANHLATPGEIIVFAFNKKAKTEINERLTKITFDEQPLFTKIPEIATTFHAFAYQTLGGKSVIKNNIITEAHQNRLIFAISKRLMGRSPEESEIAESLQFITRTEQKFFNDYDSFLAKVPKEHENLSKTLTIYHSYLKKHGLINFNQMMSSASQNLKSHYRYKYLFIDEYQDFSLLFLTLIQNLLERCENPHLLAVGDDWQAINRFAGSDIEYFKNFEKYFKEDSKKLFIPTNYRSGKLIVKNANFFMWDAMNDPAGCRSGNKLKAQIFITDLSKYRETLNQKIIQALTLSPDITPPINICKSLALILKIIEKHPKKSIKLLSRNNQLNASDYSLEFLLDVVKNLSGREDITATTIHRSKGLEADLVILLEIDAEKFPKEPKVTAISELFNDTRKSLLDDENRLFYVGITRAKEKLYIFTKSSKPTKENKDLNFLNFLDRDLLVDLI